MSVIHNITWQKAKAETNLEKHGLDFIDAVKVFAGEMLTKRSDRAGETRYLTIGEVEGLEIAVIYTIWDGSFRIISAR